ncbi:cation:proton antiporter [Sphingomonas sp. IW22]|uniref:cation:proton antiporter n=1 Tax=Sphingomonas sp. IW22 TaxID=3242489 RepID=UPI00351FA2DC
MDELTKTPDLYIILLTAAGALIALVAWLPLVLKRLPLSLPIVCIVLGALAILTPLVRFDPSPLAHPVIAERFTEFVVIIALMGAGLKIDRPFSWRTWGVTWRLLGITMPLSIGAILLLGHYGLGLSLVASLLLGASLAPTDPVLASDIQVGPPQGGAEDEVRFGLTSEAGFNDGLAFPFVNLAIVMALSAGTGEPWLVDWLTYNVAWEIGAGALVGWIIGKAFGWLTFRMPGQSALAKTGDGLIAVSATFVSYGVTEMLHCYGFLAVFVTALTFRSAHRNHDFQREMHDLTEQVERLAMMVLLLLFGASLVTGLLRPVGWTDVLVALAIIFLVRPVSGLLGMWGTKTTGGERASIAFFGIRGVGSFYYLAYALNEADFAEAERLWGIVGLVALLSILIHGLTVTPLIRLLDRTHGRDPDAQHRKAVPPGGQIGPAGTPEKASD